MNELQTVTFGEFSDELAPGDGKFSLSNVPSPNMFRLMTDCSHDDLRRQLHRFCIPTSLDFLNAPIERQNEALASFEKGYLPKDAPIAFAGAVIAKVREVYRAKQFDGEQFKLYFHSNLDVLKGCPLKPIPSCLADTAGLGFSAYGPSLMGRTSLIRALSGFLGPAFRVEGNLPYPKLMWVVPILVLTYPSCRTLKGLIREIRYRILAAIGSANTKPNALASIERADGENVAIALCTLMNVGLIVLDGPGFLDVNSRTPEIFRFLFKLRQYTGIPVLLSGTSAFMHSASFLGNTTTNLFNGDSLCFDMAKLPEIDAEKGVPKAGNWTSMCRWLWRQLFKAVPMPAELPRWTFLATQGRDGWLVQGFHSLAKYVISNADSLQPGRLTFEIVYAVFLKRLELHEDALAAIMQRETYEQNGNSAEQGQRQLKFIKHLDHMPTSMFKKGRCKEWIDHLMLKRLGGA